MHEGGSNARVPVGLGLDASGRGRLIVRPTLRTAAGVNIDLDEDVDLDAIVELDPTSTSTHASRLR